MWYNNASYAPGGARADGDLCIVYISKGKEIILLILVKYYQ